MRPRIKICCISSAKEANLAIQMGAAALGLVGAMPSGPGVISNERIREIAETIPPPISTFLLTSETNAASVIRHHHQTHTTTIQLVDDMSSEHVKKIREALPAVKLVQVVHVLSEASIDEALEAATHADALLLDSGNPRLAVKILGGTGNTHNWDISARIVKQSPVPVFLAGGLNAQNVQEAVQKVNPFGLDLCSGVRTNGQLDPRKLETFFRSAGY